MFYVQHDATDEDPRVDCECPQGAGAHAELDDAVLAAGRAWAGLAHDADRSLHLGVRHLVVDSHGQVAAYPEQVHLGAERIDGLADDEVPGVCDTCEETGRVDDIAIGSDGEPYDTSRACPTCRP